MKQTYTPEQKQQYFEGLRARWRESKKLAEGNQEITALFKEAEATGIGKISFYSFAFTLQDMRANGFDGLPYIDCKTFDGWKRSGYRVKKGEHSKINGIVWKEFGNKKETEDEEDDPFIFPKLYHLFHKSQVEPIA